MTTINFTDQNLGIEEKYLLITELLSNNRCNIVFQKINGEIREMSCTLQEIEMGATGHVLKDEITQPTVNYNVITVWCLEKQAWRSMRTENIQKITTEEQNRWSLTVEEDPDTGEAVLIFPPEMLAKVGWKEGDIIKWSRNDDDSWTLEKSSPTP